VCGIVGYLGNQEAWPIILEGLQRLEYRGYDSAGIAIADSAGQLHFRKTVGKVAGLVPVAPERAPQGLAGIGHTRWATHGKPSNANAHPQTECLNDIALVHNGIVENFVELKRRLQDQGHRFTSDTDTEVIAHLIEEGCAQGLSFESSFRRLGGLLKGSHAIAAMIRGEAGKICVMRLGNAGGLVVANRDGQSIVASDLPAMLPLFRMDSPSGDVGFLEPGEMAVVTRNRVEYLDLEGGLIEKQLRHVTPEDVLIDKGGYRHFMLKEIMEQPQAVAAALRERVDFEQGRVQLPDFPISESDINQLQRVMLIGCGTSLHAAQVGRYLFERLAGLPAEVESASEFRYRDAYINERTLYISIAQSGETADTVAAMHEIKANGGRLITICNVSGSQTSRLAEGTLYMRSGMEVGVASTKTFIASLTILNLLAVYLGQVRGQIDPEDSRRLVDDLARCPTLIGDMLTDTSQYHALARRFVGYDNFMFLGRGINSPIASEGALKLKEISYIHAEGYPAGEMKHGPIALIDESMCTLALAPRDALFEKMLSNVREVKARDGVVIGVGTAGDTELAEDVDEIIYIPLAPDHLVPMLATIPLQLLAYHIAVLRGCDVDQPRNLAKSVTVE
jgi:glucosamine--fructose-6-phosphate aminotransferase (isomerizing)